MTDMEIDIFFLSIKLLIYKKNINNHLNRNSSDMYNAFYRLSHGAIGKKQERFRDDRDKFS